MPQHKPIPGSASDWLARAKGDLALARGPLPEGAFLEDLCFHAQQVAEKAIKALYVHHGLVFRYTHDLDDLLTALKKHGMIIPVAVYGLGRWRKLKGIASVRFSDGFICKAEVHWYEAHGIGKKEIKLKKLY